MARIILLCMGASILIFAVIGQGWPVFAQEKEERPTQRPPLDLLLSNIDSYWKLLLERKRTEAGQYVVQSEREAFAARTTPKFTDPRIRSLEFTPRETEIKVTVVVKRNLNFGIMDWPVSEIWLFQDGNWYLRPNEPGIPGSPAERRALRIEQEENLKTELRKMLRFEKSVLDFGMVQRGMPATLSLKYSLDGSDAVPVSVEKSSALLKVEGLDSQRLLPGQDRELKITMRTDTLEGVILENLTLTARRNDVEIPFKIALQGFVYVPISFAPKVLRLNPGNEAREKTIVIRNNSKSALKLQSFSTRHKVVEVAGLPATVASGQELTLKVTQVRDVAQKDTEDTLTLVLAKPVEDVASFPVRLFLNATDKRDGLIMDPAKMFKLPKQLEGAIGKPPNP